MVIKSISIDKLYNNNGQIKGLSTNPRQISTEDFLKLKKSIQDNPEMLELRELIVYPHDDDYFIVIAGNMRLRAMKELEFTYATCKVLDKNTSLEKLKAYTIKDNISRGEWDFELLANEWDVDELIEFGLDLPVDFGAFENEDELDNENEDNIPEVLHEPKTKMGDVWILGKHRLMCGDSINIDNVDKLMNGNKAEMVFTSPPYNVGKTPNGNENKYLEYQDNKNNKIYLELLTAFTLNFLNYSDFIFCNIQSLAGNKIALIDYLYNLKNYYADTIIWDKTTAEPAMAKNVLNSQFEYIHIFSHAGNRVISKNDFRGTCSNVFSLNSRSGKEYASIHKATFRVELPEYFITNFSKKSVIDCFAGTGTTLIACEKTKRINYSMELDPHYCDVIIKRWQDYTKKDAILESTQQKFNDL